MSSPSERRTWLERTERRNLTRTPEELPKAKTSYRRLGHSAKVSLVQEIVETRASELCKAYGNVVDVSSGYKLRRRWKGEQKSVSRTPCVRFIVKRKWANERGRNPLQKIPKCLFAYTILDGTRVLCAVPTDVISAADYLRVGPQRDRVAVTPRQPGSPSQRRHHAYGVITCAVRRGEFPQQLYAMSCRHVFSLVADRPRGRFFLG